MSSNQQPEDMRPIPDGGLKDAMPGWLKRPPAWRNMPTAQERHERALPEPDTSEIDPATLVDVNDLPQWLQTIAARGEIPLSEPDESVGYALEQIQAAASKSTPNPDPVEVAAPDSPEPEPQAEEVAKPSTKPEMGLMSDEPAGVETGSAGAIRPPSAVWALVGVGLFLIVIGILAYTFL